MPKSIRLQDHDFLKMWQFEMSPAIPQFQDGTLAKVTSSWTWVQCGLEDWESGLMQCGDSRAYPLFL